MNKRQEYLEVAVKLTIGCVAIPYYWFKLRVWGGDLHWNEANSTRDMRMALEEQGVRCGCRACLRRYDEELKAKRPDFSGRR